MVPVVVWVNLLASVMERLPLTPSSAQPALPGAVSTKPVSKSNGPSEPLHAASNGKNDQNVDPSAVPPMAMEVSANINKPSQLPTSPAPPAKTAAAVSATLKRSAGTASGGAEKRKKGLKRL